MYYWFMAFKEFYLYIHVHIFNACEKGVSYPTE